MDKKRKMIWGCMGIALILILINLTVMRKLFAENQATEATYNEFLEQLEEKNIDRVQVESDVIHYVLKEDEQEENSDVEFGIKLPDYIQKWKNQEKYYYTNRMTDMNLVDRLYESGAIFSQGKTSTKYNLKHDFRFGN